MALTVDDVIKKYMELRAEKEQIEADTKDRVRSIKESMEKIESWLKAKADTDGVTSFKTEHGTAFLATTDYATVADWDATLNFIKSEDAYDLLDKRVNKTAVRGYIDCNKEVPPGINYGTKLGVNIRRPTRT